MVTRLFDRYRAGPERERERETLPTSHRAIIKHNLEQTSSLNRSLGGGASAGCGILQGRCQPARQTLTVCVILWRTERRHARINEVMSLTSTQNIAVNRSLFSRRVKSLKAVLFSLHVLVC